MRRLFFLLFISLAITSCTFTENITINPDGTGFYSMDMDGSGLMAMMPNDSLGGKKEKPVDSTFSFKQLFQEKKDSISKLSKAEQEKIKKLENFNMRVKMNPDAKQFLFSMNTNFKSVSDLQDVMDNMSELNRLNKTGRDMASNPLSGSSMFATNGSKINYFYDGNKFIRKAIVDKKAIKEMEVDSLEQYKMISESSKYILKYHFPKPVKSISNKTALFSEDRKTITIEHTFNEYMKEPEKLNFEVIFQ